MAIPRSIGRYLVLGAIAFTVSSCGDQQRSDSEPTAEQSMNAGEVFFEDRCAVCHGMDGKAGISGATDLSTSKLSDDQIKNLILNGQNTMPPFKLFIKSDTELAETIEHVKSLRAE